MLIQCTSYGWRPVERTLKPRKDLHGWDWSLLRSRAIGRARMLQVAGDPGADSSYMVVINNARCHRTHDSHIKISQGINASCLRAPSLRRMLTAINTYRLWKPLRPKQVSTLEEASHCPICEMRNGWRPEYCHPVPPSFIRHCISSDNNECHGYRLWSLEVLTTWQVLETVFKTMTRAAGGSFRLINGATSGYGERVRTPRRRQQSINARHHG
ncbi:hypothetical protein BDW75DRAFT_1386 [Aspergillus navahoensis]